MLHLNVWLFFWYCRLRFFVIISDPNCCCCCCCCFCYCYCYCYSFSHNVFQSFNFLPAAARVSSSPFNPLKLIVAFWRHMETQIWVNIGSSNGLLPGDTKPLPEPNFTYHKSGPVTFAWWQFCKIYPSRQSTKAVWKLLNEIYLKSPRGQWVKTLDTCSIVWGNVKCTLFFLSFLNIDITQVVQFLTRERRLFETV